MNNQNIVLRIASLMFAIMLLQACNSEKDPAVRAAMDQYENIMQGYASSGNEAQVVSSMAAEDLAETPDEFQRAWQDEKLSWLAFKLYVDAAEGNPEKTESQLKDLAVSAEQLRLVASKFDPQIKREIKIEEARERAAQKFADPLE